MVASIMGIGQIANGMGKVKLFMSMGAKNSACGKMIKELSGRDRRPSKARLNPLIANLYDIILFFKFFILNCLII